MTRAALLSSATSPDEHLSPSAQERARRRERRLESGHETDTSWRDHRPGAEPRLQKFLRRKEVMAATSLSNSELYALVSEGRFPKPFKLTGTTSASDRGGVTVWIEAEVAQWQAQRAASRDLSAPQRGAPPA
jgi:predicted DNA-binding transcriptional regulator AlpA